MVPSNTPRYRPPLDVLFVPDIQALFRYPAPTLNGLNPERNPPSTSPTPCSIGVPVALYPRTLVELGCVTATLDAHTHTIPYGCTRPPYTTAALDACTCITVKVDKRA